MQVQYNLESAGCSFQDILFTVSVSVMTFYVQGRKTGRIQKLTQSSASRRECEQGFVDSLSVFKELNHKYNFLNPPFVKSETYCRARDKSCSDQLQ